MRKAMVLFAVLLFSVLLIGCAQQQPSYSSYNSPQGQAPVVGGGCGVAGQAEYEQTPVISGSDGF